MMIDEDDNNNDKDRYSVQCTYGHGSALTSFSTPWTLLIILLYPQVVWIQFWPNKNGFGKAFKGI